MSALSPRIAVLKFGGTSVATPEQRVHLVARVREAREVGFSPVAIVSAMGRAPAPYATDVLLALLDGESATPESDLLLSCGESIAAAVVAKTLRDNGVPARAITGREAGIITDERFGNARITVVHPDALIELIAQGIVPVVTGFQGATPSGATTTLGRGGSDLTAVALGDALDAERIDIYTDVSGAMTADPRRIERARAISEATLEEMSELASHGAKVMHAVAAEYARERDRTYAIK
ncbi:MAG TPA: aspartate kinase, partial [Candidatus Dormibacteraeota bacterium]|nr:aspartate kinase [Candidatus Dormibacteraeota bacterium]